MRKSPDPPGRSGPKKAYSSSQGLSAAGTPPRPFSFTGAPAPPWVAPPRWMRAGQPFDQPHGHRGGQPG